MRLNTLKVERKLTCLGEFVGIRWPPGAFLLRGLESDVRDVIDVRLCQCVAISDDPDHQLRIQAVWHQEGGSREFDWTSDHTI